MKKETSEKKMQNSKMAVFMNLFKNSLSAPMFKNIYEGN
jgi:hypothetical protein